MADLGSTSNILGFSADALPRVLNGSALNLVTRMHPTLRAFLGRKLGDAGEQQGMAKGPPGMPAMENLQYHDGDKFRRRYQGRTIPAQFVGKANDNTGQFAAHTPAYTPQRFSNQFDMAQITTPYDVGKRTVDFLPQTGPTVTENFLGEETNSVVGGMIELIAPAIHGSSDASDTTLSGWQRALATTGSYLGIDLTEPNNANYLATQYATFGSCTVGKLNRITTKALKRQGNIDFVPLGETDYDIVWNVIQGEVTYDQNEAVMGILSKWPVFQGVRFCNDPYMESAYANVTTGTFPALDSSKVFVHFSNAGFTKGNGLQRNPTNISGLIEFFDCYMQVEYAPAYHVLVSGMSA